MTPNDDCTTLGSYPLIADQPRRIAADGSDWTVMGNLHAWHAVIYDERTQRRRAAGDHGLAERSEILAEASRMSAADCYSRAGYLTEREARCGR